MNNKNCNPHCYPPKPDCHPPRPDCHPPKPDCHPPKPNCNFPDFPQFCPPPPPPPPCEPQVPSVVEGQSLYQAVNNLTNRVNLCIQNYNDVMANCYATLRNMEKAAEANGSYYGPCEVWTEEGYSAEQGSTYTLIHKACVDRRGEPIRMQLHLAYGNTTNSQIEQSIFSASKITLADKMVVAQPKGANGWYGHAIWHGAPIATASVPTLYTVGFTRRGTMRVYSNTVSQDQLLNDTIENAMGCSGVLIQNGQITDDSYQSNIPSATVQTARVVMGQNMDTQEVIILCCGSYDNVQHKGMTSKACAEILLNYGCDIAVELCEDISAGAVDKGSMIFPPMNNSVPTAYCYWYISRACLYKNDYQKELAILMQNYGETLWGIYESTQKINDLSNRLDKEIQDRINGDNALNEALQKEIQDRINGDNDLNEALQAEIERAQAEEARLQGLIEQINTQITQINQTISEIQSDITDINGEITDIKGDITTINEQILQLSNRLTALTASVTALQQTVQSIQGDITNLESAVNSLSATVTNIINGSEVLPYLSINGGTMNGDINMNNNSISNVPTPISNLDAVNKKYVDDAISGSITPPTGEYLPLTGGEMKGSISLANTYKITGSIEPSSNSDLVNKNYVDSSFISKSGDTGNGNYTFNGDVTAQNITADSNLPVFTVKNSNNALYLGIDENNNAYLNIENNLLNLSSGTELSPEYTTISGVNDPVNEYDAVNKKYVTDSINSSVSSLDFLKKTGDTATGDYTFNSSENTSNTLLTPGEVTVTGATGNNINIDASALTPQIRLNFGEQNALLNVNGAGTIGLRPSGNRVSIQGATNNSLLDGVADPSGPYNAVNLNYLSNNTLSVPSVGLGFTAACRTSNKIVYATGNKSYGTPTGNDVAMVVDISRFMYDDNKTNYGLVLHFNMVYRTNKRDFYVPAMLFSPSGISNVTIVNSSEYLLQGGLPNVTFSTAPDEEYPGCYDIRMNYESGPINQFGNFVVVFELTID